MGAQAQHSREFGDRLRKPGLGFRLRGFPNPSPAPMKIRCSSLDGRVFQVAGDPLETE